MESTQPYLKQKNMNTIILILIMFLSSFISMYSQSNSNIESFIDRFNVEELAYNNNGWAHYYIPKGAMDTLTVKMSCVYEGSQTHPPHSHNEDEAFYIIDGPVIFHINNVERVLNTGDFIYTPSGSNHNIQRVNNDTIKYLVIKRESIYGLNKPYKVSKIDYTFEDCYFPYEDYKRLDLKQTSLLNSDFSEKFQVSINTLSEGEYFASTSKSGTQNAIYILEGKSTINFLNQEATITKNNTFYCPKNNQFTIKNNNESTLAFILITTEHKTQ